MKIFVKSLCTAFVIAVLLSFLPFEGECRSISDSVLRVHILANSDSDEDQQLKLKVRDAVIRESEELFSNVHSKEEAEQLVRDNLDFFARTAQEEVASNGYNYPVTATVANVCFDTRYYGDVTMPGGFYDALQIKIGQAQGKNWWCVMYPSLCISSASDNDTLDKKLTRNQYGIVSSQGEYEFRFKVVEIFSGILDFFSR